jgi:hypothetical protein
MKAPCVQGAFLSPPLVDFAAPHVDFAAALLDFAAARTL